MFTPFPVENPEEDCIHPVNCYRYKLPGGELWIGVDHSHMGGENDDFACWTDVWIVPDKEGDDMGFSDVRWGAEGDSTSYFRLPFMDEINDDLDHIHHDGFEACEARAAEINERIGEYMSEFMEAAL